MTKRITIADVAKEADVSIMTVSRAINDKEGISEATKLRILKIAEEIGYRPSSVARALVTNRSCTAGIMMPDVANPFFSQIARGAEDQAQEACYNIFLVNTDEDFNRETTALDSLLEKQVDGVILCSPRLRDKELLEYIGLFPYTVLINREINSSRDNYASIIIDDKFGAQSAIKYFLEQGRSLIGFVAGPEQSASGKQRLAGYRAGLAAGGIAFNSKVVRRCTPDTLGGYQSAIELLTNQKKISALFAFNDLVAVGVLQACEELGLRVPDDIAVIGADDIPLASLVSPKLTTLRINKRELGRQAMRILSALIAGEKIEPATQFIRPKLIIQESA